MKNLDRRAALRTKLFLRQAYSSQPPSCTKPNDK